MKNLKNKFLLKLINFYPPFLGAGIRVKQRQSESLEFSVSMPLNKLNANYVGTQFGGSLYSMCDPFFMLILMNELGKNYIVWDKAASIKFIRPGRGKVFATFKISKKEVETVREMVKTHGKYEPNYSVEVKNSKNEVVALVEKTLYVREK